MPDLILCDVSMPEFDYLTKPAGADEVLSAIRTRLHRREGNERALLEKVDLKPDFSSSKPLETLGLPARRGASAYFYARSIGGTGTATPICAEVRGRFR